MIFFDIDETLFDNFGAQDCAAKKFFGVFSELQSLFNESNFPEIWAALTEKYLQLFFDHKISFQQQRRNRIKELFQKNLSDLNTVLSWVPNEHECRMWAGPKVKFPLNTVRLAQEIEFTDDNCYALIDNETLVAFGQVIYKKNGFHHLARIIVDPSKRSAGYGRYLCTALIQNISQEGHQKFSLNVYPNNKSAFNLYKNLGFREVKQKSPAEYCHLVKALTKNI